MRYVLTACFALALIVLNFDVSVARADDVSAVISGYVHDDNGVPTTNAKVFLYSPSSASFFVTQEGLAFQYNYNAEGFVLLVPAAVRSTNHNGFFVFLGTLPGDYYVIAQMKGYHQGGCWPHATVYPNQTWRVKVTMIPPSAVEDCFFPQYQDFGISF